MQAVNTKNQCFVVWSDEIEGRFDPHFYKPEFIKAGRILLGREYKIIKFGEIIKSITNGLDYRKFSDAEGLIYVRVGNVRPFGFNLENAKRIKINLNELVKDIKLKKGNLLITRKGTFGIALAVKEDLDYIISSEVFRIELTQNVNPNYLEIILNSEICQMQFNKIKIGGIMGSLSQEAVKSIKIPIPPLEIQNQIVKLMESAYKQKEEKEVEAEKLLNSIDDYVLDELGIKIPEIKDKMCFSVNSEEVNNRLDSHYNQPKFKEIENAFKRGKYKIIEFGSVIRNINYGTIPKNYSNTGIPLLKIGNLKPNEIITTELSYIPNFPEERDKQKLTKKGDLLISQLGTVGITAPITEKEEGFLYGSFILRLQISQGNPIYFSIILNSPIGKIQFQRDMTTATVRANTSIPAVKSLKIPLPPLTIQNKIAEEVKSRIETAKKLKEEAQQIIENAKKEVEKIILNK